MKHSEFHLALHKVFGRTYGDSLAADLVITPDGKTANEALAAGMEPFRVWKALIIATDSPEEALWAHRQDERKKKN
ncbi:hypothetical protein BK816_05810 [Boudabousia tangfeifanii]|uniref:DUF3046 domain-containing protein n=1 Tax=Boudabousia tangfeifanii TaxID=1912795 RepID=A0A1D9ML11_9ACTO|nr:DUF3046 domain-containing protein [Boudabousia tangfeifanii]AOZ72869.1 hypothetical protein BK816_05810 [Boudabousia tangfeifanii]